MKYLKENILFDFLYDGNPLDSVGYTMDMSVSENTIIREYTFADGLRVTNIAQKNNEFGSYGWVNWFENISDKPTKVISKLYDAVFTMPLEKDELFEEPFLTLPDLEKATKLYSIAGSTWSAKEFFCDEDLCADDRYTINIKNGETRRVSTSGGRSSDVCAPFLNLHKSGKGFIAGIGWSGQWFYEVTRGENEVTLKSGIENAEFYLEPNEKFRTSSVLIMPYEANVTDSQNRWRRLLKKEYCHIGNEGRDAFGPLSAMIWGGMETKEILNRINTIVDYELPYDYIWLDAGWYGIDTEPTFNNFDTSWFRNTGDWRVSPIVHPQGLRDVSDAIHNANMKFVLWFEPERVVATTPNCLNHPDYFLPWFDNIRLLDLGNEEAREFCLNEMSAIIEELGIDCFRQDFNSPPLDAWRQNDKENRNGITEIKYINGLYIFWDTLLERFPHLIIDNCASGGRRIDIESMRRSVPLWRSDLCCPGNCDVASVQMHQLCYSNWLPYHGAGTGCVYDKYRIRSAYAPSMVTEYAFDQGIPFGDDPENLLLLKEMLEEYKKVRPYLTEDFYPLTSATYDSRSWIAAQYDRPENNDGLIQVFRREKSPYAEAVFELGNVQENAVYTFTDVDTDDVFTISGEELIKTGLRISLPEKRSSKIIFYKYKI